MAFEICPIKDVVIYTPKVHGDERGYFFESFNKKQWASHLTDINFVQDNQAKSSFGVLRGLHYQVSPKDQSKLIRVLEGEILDIIVDLRKKSDTYGQHFSLILNDHNKKQLFIPKGFAHGYLAKSEKCIILYKCDNYYSPEHSAGIKFDDDKLNIDWQIDSNLIVLSDQDKEWPDFNHHRPYTSE